jgi:hypothetical protein
MHIRIARPVSNLVRTERMYCTALNLTVLAKFQDHQGFDGVMLGIPGMDYHFEFTHRAEHPVVPSPTSEDLLVFYIVDRQEWQSTCDRVVENGFVHVTSLNPYWDVSGRTFVDLDGYRVVFQKSAWRTRRTHRERRLLGGPNVSCGSHCATRHEVLARLLIQSA